MVFFGKPNNKKHKPAVQSVTELTADISLDMSTYMILDMSTYISTLDMPTYLVSPNLCKSTESLASLLRNYFSEDLDGHT